jgi:hypothetical protein
MAAVTMKIRRGTSLQWASSTKPLASGELGLDTTLNKIKAGNGTTLWPALSFISALPSETIELAQDAIDTALVAGTGLTKVYNDNANTITLTVDNTIIANKAYVDAAIVTLSAQAVDSYVPVSIVGNPDGIATLDATGKIPDSEIPATIARDTEIASAISTEVTNRNSAITTAITNLIDTAPDALNTLNELAAAINDDASYAATVTTALGTINTSLGTKAPIDSPTFTGTVVLPLNTIRSSDLAWEMYSAESQLPNPGSKHGMFAHVHGTGGAYFAHTGKWWRIALMDEPSVDYYITNSGTGTYLVNGVSNGGINFVKGKKYRIIVNAVGHPFRIQTVSGGYSLADSYTTGITNAGTDNGSIIVELPQNAPDNLYYACEFHPTMNGTIAVQAEEDTITINSKSASYTIAPIDSGRLIEMSAGGTVTITDSTLFPIGYSVDILQTGTSQVTIAGDGFTPNSTPGLKLRAQWSSATLIKRALNSWVILGDLSA